MSAYIIFIRNKTVDPEGMAKYASLARLAPGEKIELLAAKTCPFEVLEGPPAEAVVIMRFPSRADAMAWYKSDAYQKALPFRQASGQFQAFVVDGVS